MKRVIAIFLTSFTLILTGAGCFGGSTGSSVSSEEITLKYWRVYDEKDDFDAIIDDYEAIHPNVKIEYKTLRPEEYETELIKALAAGEGPDIFAIPNAKLAEYSDFLRPMPDKLNVSYLVTKGTLRKETSLEARQESTPSLKTLRDNFIPVVLDDVVLPYQPDPDVEATDEVFALPLSVDTLALFFNRDLLNAGGIANPPTNWTDMNENVVPKLTKINEKGEVVQSGIALGTVDNVDRASDILAVLMMQNGTEMTDDRGRVSFQLIPEGTEDGIFPGLDAVSFYTDFANPTKKVYSWNNTFPSSLEAFANGQTAFFLGYSYDIPLIEAAAPKLDYGISALPQIAGTGTQKVNYANYWAEGVSKRSENPDYAWNFIIFATDEENVGSYLASAHKPTALRSLIETQLEDEELGVFASSLLTAKSWYHGQDADAMEKALRDLAKTILQGTDEPEKAISQAAKVVSQTY